MTTAAAAAPRELVPRVTLEEAGIRVNEKIVWVLVEDPPLPPPVTEPQVLLAFVDKAVAHIKAVKRLLHPGDREGYYLFAIMGDMVVMSDRSPKFYVMHAPGGNRKFPFWTLMVEFDDPGLGPKWEDLQKVVVQPYLTALHEHKKNQRQTRTKR